MLVGIRHGLTCHDLTYNILTVNLPYMVMFTIIKLWPLYIVLYSNITKFILWKLMVQINNYNKNVKSWFACAPSNYGGCEWQRTLQASPLPGMEKKGKTVLERKCSWGQVARTAAAQQAAVSLIFLASSCSSLQSFDLRRGEHCLGHRAGDRCPSLEKSHDCKS